MSAVLVELVKEKMYIPVHAFIGFRIWIYISGHKKVYVSNYARYFKIFSNRFLCCDFITLYKSTKNAAERHLMHHIWISISKVTAFQTLHFE